MVIQKQCKTCKYWDYKEICLNPMNDMIYDYFNASTGELVKNIRRASSVRSDEVCTEWVKRKNITPPSEIGEY